MEAWTAPTLLHANRPLRHGDFVGTVEMQQAQRVLGAVMHIGVPADARDGEQLQLRSRDCERNRERVVETRVAVDDDRQRLLYAPARSRSICERRVMEGRPSDPRVVAAHRRAPIAHRGSALLVRPPC